MFLNEDCSQRLNDSRQQLQRLQELGFQYIATSNDGDTWTGTNQPGLEIKELLQHGCFLGEVEVRADLGSTV